MVSETAVSFNNLRWLSARKYFNRRVQKIAKTDHLLRVCVHPAGCLSTWKYTAPTVCMKFDIGIYFENQSRKFDVESKNNGYLI